MFKRVALCIITNLAIVLVLGIVLNLPVNYHIKFIAFL